MTEYQTTINYTNILDKEIKKKNQVIYFQLSKKHSELIVTQEALKTLWEKEKLTSSESGISSPPTLTPPPISNSYLDIKMKLKVALKTLGEEKMKESFSTPALLHHPTLPPMPIPDSISASQPCLDCCLRTLNG